MVHLEERNARWERDLQMRLARVAPDEWLARRDHRGHFSENISGCIFVAAATSFVVMSSLCVSYLSNRMATLYGCDVETTAHIAFHAGKIVAVGEVYALGYCALKTNRIMDRLVGWSDSLATAITGVKPFRG